MTYHQQRDGNVLPQTLLLSFDEPLRGESRGEHLCLLPLVTGTGAPGLGCSGGGTQPRHERGAQSPGCRQKDQGDE